VQVGDVIKVQTNLGWESVTVRAKRTNGKIDIQFKDGEYMRSVLPRILRESLRSEANNDVHGESEGGGSAITTGSDRAGGNGSSGFGPGVGPLPGGADGAGNGTGAGQHGPTTVEEALATLDAQLSAQIRARRSRAGPPPRSLKRSAVARGT